MEGARLLRAVRELDREQTTEAVADPVGALDPEIEGGLGEVGDVLCDPPGGLPAGVPVPAEIEADDPPCGATTMRGA